MPVLKQTSPIVSPAEPKEIPSNNVPSDSNNIAVFIFYDLSWRSLKKSKKKVILKKNDLRSPKYATKNHKENISFELCSGNVSTLL